MNYEKELDVRHEKVCKLVDEFARLVSKIASSDEKAKIRKGAPFVDAVLDCDHHMVMIQAFQNLFDREPWFPSDLDRRFCTEEEMNEDHSLIESAWEVCEDNHYFI